MNESTDGCSVNEQSIRSLDKFIDPATTGPVRGSEFKFIPYFSKLIFEEYPYVTVNGSARCIMKDKITINSSRHFTEAKSGRSVWSTRKENTESRCKLVVPFAEELKD